MENVVYNQSEYVKPKLTSLGRVGDVTLSQGDGDFTDFAYPQTTPKDQLTFS